MLSQFCLKKSLLKIFCFLCIIYKIKCLKTTRNFKTIFSSYLPKKELAQEKQKPTNEEQFTSSQLGWFWFSFLCSFIQLQNKILQLTLVNVLCKNIT